MSKGRSMESFEMPASARQLAAMMDHTLLQPQATPRDIARLAEEAALHRCHAVCVNPVYVAEARRRLDGTGVRVCTVVGFPLGAATAAVKAAEAREAIERGASEIDMVMFIGGLKAGEEGWVRDDIAGVVAVCRAAGAVCKVILETCLLSETEKDCAARLCVEAGAHFVKTSTGFSTGGATVEDVARLAAIVRPAGLGVKASGGIRTLEDALRMIRAGATRLGTSRTVEILRGWSERGEKCG
ncbi:MAG: deoxyribose-phosphate aldolase [Kiritimatiellae bacterium]|nr:deoxyribose-phosphate aldolase [Kiritimatiellia bacterium]